MFISLFSFVFFLHLFHPEKVAVFGDFSEFFGYKTNFMCESAECTMYFCNVCVLFWPKMRTVSFTPVLFHTFARPEHSTTAHTHTVLKIVAVLQSTKEIHQLIV